MHNSNLILIAEDSSTQALLLKTILEQHNFSVVVADDGQMACNWLSKNIPALVISDIMMPDMNGYELCRRIKSDFVTENVPVLLLTSLSGPEEVIEGLSCGADSFITKPFNEEFLISFIQKVIEDKTDTITEKKPLGLEITFQGKKRIIQADPQNVINLMVSIYQGAIQQNEELQQTKDELWDLNDRLESLVAVRTQELMHELAERKRSEQLLQISEMQYRFLTENSPDLIARFSRYCEHLFVNPAAARVGPFTQEQYIGKNLREVGLVDSEALKWESRISSVFETGRILTVEDEFRTPDGTKFYRTQFIPEIAPDGTVYSVQSIAHDITDRKQAEISKQIQLNIARSMVFAQTLEDLVDLVRQELSRMVDTSCFSVELFPENPGTLADLVILNGRTIMITKEEIVNRVAEQKQLVNGPFPECWLGVPIFQNGKAVGAICLQSMTNQEAYDDETIGLLVRIAREFSLFIERKGMIEDLVAARKKAEESDRLKSAFLANMSHEIRTPLNSIIGFSELLHEEENAIADVIRFSGIIKSSGNRLLQLISNLIDISKIESGTERVNEGDVLPAQIIHEVASQLRLIAERKSIEIIESIPTVLDGLVLKTDSLKLHQVLTNLISNALKFTMAGGVVEIGLNRIPDRIQFFVRDTGIGIPATDLDLVFNRFHQVDPIRVKSSEGAGLGLSLCKSIIELLGGRIWVESNEGLGSTFYFTLPCTLG